MMVKPRRATRRPTLRYLVWLAVLGAAAYIGYSVWYTYKVQPEQGLVTCVPKKQSSLQPAYAHEQEGDTEHEKQHAEEQLNAPANAGKCFYSAHIHTTIDLNRCGVKIDMPKDKGRLRGPHTHKEPNKIHSPHSPQQVDPATKQFLDPTPLTIRGFLDAMEIDTTTPCPGASTSTAVVTVNGQPEPSGPNYLWQDGDRIRVVYN